MRAAALRPPQPRLARLQRLEGRVSAAEARVALAEPDSSPLQLGSVGAAITSLFKNRAPLSSGAPFPPAWSHRGCCARLGRQRPVSGSPSEHDRRCRSGRWRQGGLHHA